MSSSTKIALSSLVTSVPLVGQSYANKLKNLNIFTVADLLHHYPIRYLDRRHSTLIKDLQIGETVTIHAQLLNFRQIYTKSGKNLQQASIIDSSGSLTITWFNQRFLSNALRPGEKYAFSGKVREYRGQFTLSAPDFELLDTSKETLHSGRLVPVYPETLGVSSKWLRSRLKLALQTTDITDHLPSNIVNSEKLLDLCAALKYIHFPDSDDHLNKAKRRLAFDELFLLQLQGAFKRKQWHQLSTPYIIKPKQSDLDTFINKLPFILTSAQVRACGEILTDLSTSTPMNRILEGDVGSGKTVVAAITFFAAFLSGYRSLFMAPTEILAHQHYQELKRLFKGTSVSVGLLTGSTKSEGYKDILVGTHALLYQTKKPEKISLIIIDEQHRFGVQQRYQLENISPHPHRLTMSATPIPRTVALTLYGDLDVSILDQMPKNRLPVKTWVVPHTKRNSAYSWIKKQITENHSQVFVVCPLIDPSQSLKLTQVKAVTDEYLSLQKIFPGLHLALLHGRLKSSEKEEILLKFKNKKTNILVSTPVIEVGIDIPSATIMVIEAAERFGLAQLHQLRGRVGRGDQQSYCLLFTSTANQTESRRLTSLTKFNSGFKLAQVDLKLRGPGEVFGITQHGFTQLKLAKLSDHKLLSQTKLAAHALLNQDPNLQSYTQLLKFITSSTFSISPN